MGCVSSTCLQSLDFLAWTSSTTAAAAHDEGGNPKEDGTAAKQYSWDIKRQEIDVSKYIFEDVLDTELVKQPGDINGKASLHSLTAVTAT